MKNSQCKTRYRVGALVLSLAMCLSLLAGCQKHPTPNGGGSRSEEHTSELQSLSC